MMYRNKNDPTSQVQRLESSVRSFVPGVPPAPLTRPLPRVDCMEPALQALEAGQRYAWCTCGLSRTQPFCDGSHRGTDWQPLVFTAKRTQLDWICTCKFTRQPPYCDAAHNRLPQHYRRHLKEHGMPAVTEPEWQSPVPANGPGPRIVLIHGFLAGKHMARHLLRWVREAGFEDASLFSNATSPAVIADFMSAAAQHQRPLVLIGYSQGGFQVLKVARVLARRGQGVNLVVSIAAGGVGRLHPAQWGFRVRHLPDNIQRLLNVYSCADAMGTDPLPGGNQLKPRHGMVLENIALAKSDAVDHLTLVRCYPAERVHPVVAERVLAPVQAALTALADPCAG